MSIFRREWGAITFVLTVLIGAVAVAISLVVQGAHAPPVPTLAPCPSYTPYVVTPVASAPASPSAAASASTSPSAGSSASPAVTGAAALTPTPTAFNPALANCPTPPTRPSASPTAVGSTPTATPSPTPTPVPTPTPTSAFPTLPPATTSSP